jgi:putative membrane protein
VTAPRAFAMLRVSLLLGFVALSGISQARNAQAPNAHRRVLDAREQAFVAQATADNAMQIALAKLAMEKSGDPRLRALASRIVSDHSALNLQFAQLAAARSSKGRAHGTSAQDIAAMEAHLQSLHGEAFDQAFAGMMMKEHRKIIAAYAAAARNSADSQLKALAARGLPVLQEHAAAARALLQAGKT